MEAWDGSGGRAGSAEAVETGGEVGRARRRGVELRQAIEVGAEELHVPGLAPRRQPVELVGKDGRHLGEHGEVPGSLGRSEPEPDETIKRALQAAVAPRAAPQPQRPGQILERDFEAHVLSPQHRQPAEQQDAGRADQRCPALLDVGMVEREPGLANWRRGVRDRM